MSASTGRANAIVDTCSLFPYLSNLESPYLRILFEVAPQQGWNVFVPEVVVRETVQKFRDHVEDGVRRTESASKDLHRLTGFSVCNSVSPLEIDETVNSFRRTLVEAIEQNGGSVSALPGVEHDELIDRAIRKRRPFGERRGYQDALIWYSVLELVEKYPVKTVLITDNYKDFGRGENDCQINLELAASIWKRTNKPNLITLSRGIKDFVNVEVRPKLSIVDESILPFHERSYGQSISKDISKILQQAVVEVSISDPSFWGFPEWITFVHAEDVLHIHQWQEVDTRQLSAAEVAVEIAVICEVGFDVAQYEFSEGIANSRFDEFKVNYAGSGSVELELTLVILVDAKTGEVISKEIDELSADSAQIWGDEEQ